jgi:hypothetical protein
MFLTIMPNKNFAKYNQEIITVKVKEQINQKKR